MQAVQDISIPRLDRLLPINRRSGRARCAPVSKYNTEASGGRAEAHLYLDERGTNRTTSKQKETQLRMSITRQKTRKILTGHIRAPTW